MCGSGHRKRDEKHCATFITPRLRWFYRSIHQIVGHRVELLGVDTARDQVYCRAEREFGERWVVMAQLLVAAAPSRASTTSVDRYARSSDGHGRLLSNRNTAHGCPRQEYFTISTTSVDSHIHLSYAQPTSR